MIVSVFLLATIISRHTLANIVEYPPVSPNVPYSAVTELGYRQADHKIHYGDDQHQYALLWQASTSSTTRQKPLIVLIHGGCWLNAFDITHTFPLSTGLSQAGFDVWSLEYRRTGDEGGGWPGTFADIQQGIQAATQYDERYTLNNMIIIGHSAGGHLALLAGSIMQQLKGIVGLAAITNIEQYSRGSNSCQRVTKDFMTGTFEEKPGTYKLANPIQQPHHPNSILLQGDADGIVPQSQALNSGFPTEMISEAGHFDWIHPGSDAYTILIQTLEAMSKS